MTVEHQDPPDAGGPETTAQASSGGLRPGIYLEKRQSVIGTGSTAKTAEYRNFWATGLIRENSAVMVLLDDEFQPTGIKETFRHEVLTGAGWFFVEQGDKKYQRLRPALDRLCAPPPPPSPQQPQAAAGPAAGQWWAKNAPTGPPADPFARDKPAPKKAPAPKKGGWWDR